MGFLFVFTKRYFIAFHRKTPIVTDSFFAHIKGDPNDEQEKGTTATADRAT